MKIHGNQISLNLYWIKLVHCFGSFQFHHNLIVNQQIHPKSIIERLSFIIKRNNFLASDEMTSLRQFSLKKSLIHGFQHSGPEMSVYLDGSIKNVTRYVVYLRAHCASATSLPLLCLCNLCASVTSVPL